MEEQQDPLGAIWEEDVRRWLKELKTARLEISRVEKLLGAHEGELRAHLASMREGQFEYPEHERIKRHHHTLMAGLGLLARGMAALEEEVEDWC